jgi:hypothetical protein
MYDGELAVGTAMFVDVDGTKVAAPAGKIECKDGMIITIDGDGLVTEILPAEEKDEEITVEEVIEAMAKINKSVVALSERFTVFEKSQIKGEQKFQNIAEGGITWKKFTKKTK